MLTSRSLPGSRFSAGVVALVLSCAAPPHPAVPSPPIAAPPVGPVVTPLAAAEAPPVAPVRPVRDERYGETVTDPYRWMETPSPEYDKWLRAEADFSRKALDALPERAAFLSRVRELDQAGPRLSALNPRASRFFYRKAKPGEKGPKLYVRDRVSGDERVLLDPMEWTDGPRSLDWYAPSPSGDRVAVGLSVPGTEESVLQVMEVSTGKVTSDRIDRCRGAQVSWMDERSFLYSRHARVALDAPPAEKNQKVTVFAHTLGADPDKDTAVLGFGVAPTAPFDPSDYASAWAPAGSAYVVGYAQRGAEPTSSLYVAPRAALTAHPIPWRRVVDAHADHVVWNTAHGDDLYLLSLEGAPRGHVLHTRLSHPDLSTADEVLPQGDGILTEMTAAKDALYVSERDGAVGRLLRVPYGKNAVAQALPLSASAAVTFAVGRPQDSGVFFPLESWMSPRRWYRYDPESGKVTDTGLLTPQPDDATVTVREETVTSADGTKVPLSVLVPRSATGPAPAILEGYGAYGDAEDPWYQATRGAWLERGGIRATCHVRGGGEKGEAWHEAGKGAHKQNGIDDFIACAQWMIANSLTSPSRLAAEGGSAGGILVGGAITQHPELFGAAVIYNGVMDVLRFEQTAAGTYNAPEYGTVATGDGFHALLAQDATLHVKDDVHYPAVMLTTGTRDARVVTWQPAKMAARLQAASSSGRPVLLRVDYEAGHGRGETTAAVRESTADTYAFLWANLAHE